MPKLYFLRGFLSVTIAIANTVILSIPLFAITILRVIFPIPAWRRLCSKLAVRIAELWCSVNNLWIRWFQVNPLEATITGELSRKKWYLITANHQNAADILIAQYFLNGRVPLPKFFLKRELIWVPILGLCWWALDFPFMRRYSKSYLAKHPHKRGKDLEETRKACSKFKYTPTSIFNYMEGTRLTPKKLASSNSPYKHLLMPKAGGVGLALGILGEQIEELIDITIQYPSGIPSLWEFVCGKADDIRVDIRVVPIPNEIRQGDYAQDKETRKATQTWVNQIWSEKDTLLEQWSQSSSKA